MTIECQIFVSTQYFYNLFKEFDQILFDIDKN